MVLIAFASARRLLEAALRTTANGGRLCSALAIALAGLAHREEAARQGNRPWPLMPCSHELGATSDGSIRRWPSPWRASHEAALEP